MGSSRPPDRSLGSGISFPQWMKGKVDSRFDFDQSTFSPPSHDDSFFYISYSKLGAAGPPSASSESSAAGNPPREGFQSINSVLSEAPRTVKPNIPDVRNANVDLSRHPIACQQSFTSSKGEQSVSNKLISKSQQQGNDFDTNTPVGLCGKSIVSVANRIMSSSITKKISDANNFGPRPETDRTATAAEILKRRGSRSLPVSPINSPISTPDSSPKSRRRVIQNRFFTGGLVPDNKSSSSVSHGWFLSSILNQSRDIIGHDKINEEDEVESVVSPPSLRSLSRKKSISSQNLTYLGINPDDYKKEQKSDSVMQNVQNIFQPEPSELREMNFLSPTSM